MKYEPYWEDQAQARREAEILNRHGREMKLVDLTHLELEGLVKRAAELLRFPALPADEWNKRLHEWFRDAGMEEK
jgi:hypothetical protein